MPIAPPAPGASPTPALGPNRRAARIARRLAAEAGRLGVGVRRGGEGPLIVDCGHRHRGGLEAGLRLAQASLGGLAEVALVPMPEGPLPWGVTVRTAWPVAACLGCQYAGWSFESADGPLLGSGPARTLARPDPVADEFAPREREGEAVLVVEGPVPPPAALAREAAGACGVAPDRLALLHAPTGSLAGAVQVAARALECAMARLRGLGFDPRLVREGAALAGLAAPHPDPVAAMGRSNDAILYGARVHLWTEAPQEEARRLAEALPSCRSPEWGRPFAEAFVAAGGAFASIEPGLFAPALVRVTALGTGRSFESGRTLPVRLRAAAGLG